jgi:hypothetical protein
MKHFKLRLVSILLLGLAIGYFGARTAYAFVANKHWASSSANYRFASNYPTGAFRDRAHDAANTWTNVTTSSWTWNFNTLFPNGDLSYTTIDGAGGTLAGVSAPTCGGTNVCSFSMVVDSAESWFSGTSTPSASEHDLRSVLTHEFGHAAWAGHTNLTCTGTSGPTMCGSLAKGTTHFRTLEADDRDGLASVYP